MKTILKIGHHHLLFETEKEACDCLRLISKAVPCYDFHAHVTIEDEPVEMEVKILPPNAKFRRKTQSDPTGSDPANEIIVTPHRGTPKRLASPRKLIGGGA